MEALIRLMRGAGALPLALFSGALALSFGLGYRLDGMRWWDVLAYVCAYSAVFFIAACGAAAFLRRHPLRLFVSDAQRGAGRFWVASFALLLACYTLCFLENWPGVLTQDSLSSIEQALGVAEWSNWHPFAFTALVAPFVLAGDAWGDIAVGVAFYSTFQLTLCAAVLSYVCRWLYARGARKGALAALAFFALNPVIAKYSITMWKDVPFSLAMALYVLALFDVAMACGPFRAKGAVGGWPTKGRLPWSSGALLIASSLAVCLLRSNGVYVVAVVAMVLLAMHWRRFCAWMRVGIAASPIAAILVVTLLYGALGVKPAPFQEAVGVPLQQLGAVAAAGALDGEEAATVGQLIPVDILASVYDPDSVNAIKYDDSFRSEWLDDHKGEFASAWASIGLDHPDLYVGAWLEGTRGFWNFDDYGWMTSERGYLGDGGRNLLYEITGLSMFDVPSDDDYDFLRRSVFYPVFNVASWAWLVLFAVACCFRFRVPRLVLPMLPLALLWGTMMVAAPVSWEPRYLFSLHVLLPVVVVFAFWVAGGLGEKAPSAPSSWFPSALFGARRKEAALSLRLGAAWLAPYAWHAVPSNHSIIHHCLTRRLQAASPFAFFVLLARMARGAEGEVRAWKRWLIRQHVLVGLPSYAREAGCERCRLRFFSSARRCAFW